MSACCRNVTIWYARKLARLSCRDLRQVSREPVRSGHTSVVRQVPPASRDFSQQREPQASGCSGEESRELRLDLSPAFLGSLKLWMPARVESHGPYDVRAVGSREVGPATGSDWVTARRRSASMTSTYCCGSNLNSDGPFKHCGVRAILVVRHASSPLCHMPQDTGGIDEVRDSKPPRLNCWAFRWLNSESTWKIQAEDVRPP